MNPIKFSLILCCVALVTAVAPSVHAKDSAPKRVALLVGNWDYNLNHKFDPEPSENYVSDLKNPCRDTDLIKLQLAKNGFEIRDYCNVDRKTFDVRVDSFTADLSGLPKGSIVFVYYSGHGLQFHGRVFTVPVLFQMDPVLNKLSDEAQFNFFKRNANDIAKMLQKLTDDKNVALVVLLDNCRDVPVDEKAAYNEAVSIRTGPNTLIQYATTAGDRTRDNSSYAAVLSGELAKGGDIGDIISRVSTKIWRQYDSGKRETYAETNVGPAFAALKYTPLMAGEKAVASTVSTTVIRTKKVVRNIYDGDSLDILWCEGEGEEERFQFAYHLAKRISERAHEFGVGRIQLKPLPQNTNDNGGYNVHRNLMRYDPEFPSERAMLIKIASAFPEGNFLPRRGVGVGGKPTPHYVSAFICGRVAQ